VVLVTVDVGRVLCVAGAEGFTGSVGCAVATPTVDVEGSATTGNVTTAVPVARSEVDGTLSARAPTT
jgi:hypothetical protein